MLIIGERERANLVVRTARFFHISLTDAATHTVMFYVYRGTSINGHLPTADTCGKTDTYAGPEIFAVQKTSGNGHLPNPYNGQYTTTHFTDTIQWYL